jgi:hypothetical protein
MYSGFIWAMAASHRGGRVWRLRITLDSRYPQIIDRTRDAINVLMPGQRAGLGGVPTIARKFTCARNIGRAGVKSVRYHFSNRPDDIRALFGAALDQLESHGRDRASITSPCTGKPPSRALTNSSDRKRDGIGNPLRGTF